MQTTVDGQEKIVRIGGASGFWGDSRVAAPQLVRSGRIDYLVFDYLAETTMAILVAARAKKPELGYATDFVDVAMRPVLREIAEAGIKVVSNAGGINPHGCAQALAKLIEDAGLQLRIAVVEGDDVNAQVRELIAAGQLDMFTAQPLPERVLSANAYLGAVPIAAALAAGADIVITGRCVDSAVTLGPLMHEFGWSASDFDRLAGGSLAGHIIECGCQATGGLFTDWQSVPGWATIGYPIVECRADGSFTLTKPAGHRRPGGARAGRRAAALRDRRSRRLCAARRDLRLSRRDDRGRERRPGARRRRPRPRADRRLQGLGDGDAGLSRRRHAGDRRHRRGREGAAHRRGDPRADAHAARRSRPRRLQRHPHRGARRRGLVRTARPRRRGTRSDDAGGGRPRRRAPRSRSSPARSPPPAPPGRRARPARAAAGRASRR